MHLRMNEAQHQGETLFIGIGQDISKFKDIKSKLDRIVVKSNLLENYVTDTAIYMLDPEGRIILWNEGAKRLKGYTSEEILGQHFSIFFTQHETNQGLPEKALEIANKDGIYQEEALRVRKDGSTFLARSTVTAMKDPNGVLIGFSKVTHDISDLKRQRDEIELFFETSQDLHLIVDYQGHLKKVNSAFEKLLGWNKNQLLGHLFSEFVRPDELNKSQKVHCHLSKGKTTSAFLNHWRKNDGSYLPIFLDTHSSSHDTIFASGRDMSRNQNTTNYKKLQNRSRTQQPSQIQVLSQYEPRDSHSPEWNSWNAQTSRTHSFKQLSI